MCAVFQNVPVGIKTGKLRVRKTVCLGLTTWPCRGVPRRRASCKVVARRPKRRNNVFPVVVTRRLTSQRPNVARERQACASSFVHRYTFSTSRDVVRAPAVDGGVLWSIEWCLTVANIFIDTSPQLALGPYSARQPRARKRACRFIPLSQAPLMRHCS